jgi:DNA-binding SARP family transcriptional activator/sugar lactone lactonase YvrE
MEFRILGPLEVMDDGRELSIRGRKLQALLALLLLNAGETVSRDRLIAELWGDDPPATAAKTLQVHVSRLRRELGDAVVTRGGGYSIEVPPHELDLRRFEALVAEGRAALADRRPEEAEARLREALNLWRGQPLPELADEPFAQTELGRLEQIHLDALEDHVEAELSLGRHSQAIETLERLVSRHPYRERSRALLMLALYRSGRQADALDAYRDARRALVDDLGIEPGQQLRELHEAILAQDPAIEGARGTELAAPAARAEAARAPSARAPPRRSLALPAAGLATLLVAAAVLIVVLTADDGSSQPLTDDSHAVAVIDPASGRVSRAASVGTNPGPLAFDPKSRSLWVGNLDDRSVTRVDVRPIRTGRTIAVPERPEDLAAGDGAVWVAGAPRTKPFVTARRIDARFDTRSEPVRVESLPEGSASLSLGGGALWVAPSAGRLARLDPATGEAAGARLDAGPTPTAIAAGRGAVWVADAAGAGSVSRIDARTGIAESTPLAGEPAGIAVGKGAVWVTLALGDAVARIDPGTGTVRSTTQVGHGPAGVAVGAGGVWVAKLDNASDEHERAREQKQCHRKVVDAEQRVEPPRVGKAP